jgi:hypothetical protein
MPQVNEVKMKFKVNRRDYFKKAGVAAIGSFFISSIPLRLFSKTSGKRNLNVKIHPSAVSRKVQDK